MKLKEKTDQSLALLGELKKKIINVDELTPREIKTVEQVRIEKKMGDFSSLKVDWYIKVLLRSWMS